MSRQSSLFPRGTIETARRSARRSPCGRERKEKEERKERKDLIHLFEWLAEKQSPEYRKYQELKSNGFDTIEKAVSFLNILLDLGKPIDYWEACVGPYDSLSNAICVKDGVGTSESSSMGLLNRLKENHVNIYDKVRDEQTDVASILGGYGY